jgi:hypothetical protein
MDGVWGTVNYLAPDSVVNRLYIAPGDYLGTARYEPHRVSIGNARACRGEFTLDGTGFTLVEHDSAVEGIADKDALDEVYTPETLDLVRQVTGADQVISLGWMLRRTTADRHGALPPAPDVHSDLYDTTIAHRYAGVHAKSKLPAPGTYRRAVWTSLWRAFSPPPQDWPLALCDYRTTDDSEGAPNLLFRVPELPAPDQVGAAPDADAESAASLFRYRQAHRWWYFPDMHPGEAILIKLHDTDHSIAWRTPHTSFHDTTPANPHPRESIEFRTVAYFH